MTRSATRWAGTISAFEFLFSPFGLLLGFSLFEVLGKLAASAWRRVTAAG
jgi:hypothetical protein